MTTSSVNSKDKEAEVAKKEKKKNREEKKKVSSQQPTQRESLLPPGLLTHARTHAPALCVAVLTSPLTSACV